MGSLASALEAGAVIGLGHELWRRHKDIVSGFWHSVACFFDSIDVKGFKVYQDGLVANGLDGLRIVKEGIGQGSTNYELIGKLLERGAVLVKTEDLGLVKQERDYILKITQAKLLKEKQTAALRYKLAQSKLLRQRDDFIATRIDETLKEDETGILFIGAYHDILSKLPDDILVRQVKDVAKVQQYHKALPNMKKASPRLQRLADYLVSPIVSVPT
jgi:hypothetical protein